MEQNDRKDPAACRGTNTPLGREIGLAAESHPSVASAPEAVRGSRKAIMSATAKAMADADSADFCDAVAARPLARQMVDEAAIALGVQQDRTVPVVLDAEILGRHISLARRLAAMPHAKEVGYDDPDAIARTEKAIGRTLRLRAVHIDRTRADEARLLSTIIMTMVKTCAARSRSIGDLDDDMLMELVEDACDVGIADQAGD